MRDRGGFMEFGKQHAQVYLESPGLCPSCLERYIDGRRGGARTQLVEEVVDGRRTGKWICPAGGRPYVKQFVEDTGESYGAFGWSRFPLPSRVLRRLRALWAARRTPPGS